MVCHLVVLQNLTHDSFKTSFYKKFYIELFWSNVKLVSNFITFDILLNHFLRLFKAIIWALCIQLIRFSFRFFYLHFYLVSGTLIRSLLLSWESLVEIPLSAEMLILVHTVYSIIKQKKMNFRNFEPVIFALLTIFIFLFDKLYIYIKEFVNFQEN